MKTCVALTLLAALVAPTPAQAGETNPVAKVLQLISDLEGKLTKEGAAAKKTFEEFTEFCEDTSKKTEYEIKTATALIAELKATIEKESSNKDACTTDIEKLTGDIQTDESDLASATSIREKEAADFAAEEKELTETISMIERATAILEREMAKSGASALQLQNANSIEQALAVMVQASVFSSADASRLTALVQSSSSEESDDMELGAPAGDVYKGHSGGIIGALEDLLEKGEAQLAAARKKESESTAAFEMLKQSLEDEIKFAQADLAKAKACVSDSTEAVATATGDLDSTERDLASDNADLSTLKSQCMTKAQDYEAETANRNEELKALGVAKKAVEEKSAGAQSLEYGLNQDSSTVALLQTHRSHLSSRADLANFEVVHFIRDLAKKQNSQALAQLASRMASVVKFGSAAGEDPFAKIKGLISSMLDKLEEEANKDADSKAYCDKEMSASTAKKDEMSAEIDKLTSKINSAKTKSAKLKEEVSELQSELAELASTMAEAEKLRGEEKAEYTANKPEMEAGIEGVKIALEVLREYYAKGTGTSAGEGIIGMLEVIESDFTKSLSEMTTTEETAAMAYEKWVKESSVTKATKEGDVKGKTKAAAGLDKTVAELTTDKDGVQTELDAVLEYLGKLTEKCVAKPEPYEERKKRRDAELAGLKEALEILESETVLMQRSARRTLRGVKHH